MKFALVRAFSQYQEGGPNIYITGFVSEAWSVFSLCHSSLRKHREPSQPLWSWIFSFMLKSVIRPFFSLWWWSCEVQIIMCIGEYSVNSQLQYKWKIYSNKYYYSNIFNFEYLWKRHHNLIVFSKYLQLIYLNCTYIPYGITDFIDHLLPK